jgi:hypothetical protein
MAANSPAVVRVPEEYAGPRVDDVVMDDAGTCRIGCVAMCVVNDAHASAIHRDALVHMMFGTLAWLQCCGERVVVVARAVPITEVKA